MWTIVTFWTVQRGQKNKGMERIRRTREWEELYQHSKGQGKEEKLNTVRAVGRRGTGKTNEKNKRIGGIWRTIEWEDLYEDQSKCQGKEERLNTMQTIGKWGTGQTNEKNKRMGRIWRTKEWEKLYQDQSKWQGKEKLNTMLTVWKRETGHRTRRTREWKESKNKKELEELQQDLNSSGGRSCSGGRQRNARMLQLKVGEVSKCCGESVGGDTGSGWLGWVGVVWGCW